MSCTALALVCAEKVLWMFRNLALSRASSAAWMYTVFPVPVGPANNTCFPRSTSRSNKNR